MTVAVEAGQDVPEGFKRTEVGALPRDWSVVPLAMALREVDVRAAQLGSGFVDNATVLSLTKRRGLVLQSDRFNHRVALSDVGGYKVVRRGQIVYNPYVIWEGAVHRLDGFDSGVVSPVYEVWEVSPDEADSYFVDQVLRSEVAIAAYNRLAAGAVNRRRSIKKADFLTIAIPFPPLEEQRAIAQVLSTIQRAIEATDRVIAAARQLKASLMRHLFTYGPVPLADAERVSLKETEIGPVPQHWEIMTVGEIADVMGGKRLPKGHSFSEEASPYPYVRVVDFANGSVDLSGLRFLTPADHEQIKRYIIRSQDIYISIAGTVGVVGAVPLELDGANLTENAARIIIRPESRMGQRFLMHYLSSGPAQEEIRARTAKTSQPKLALARIKQVPLPRARLAEQAIIGSALDGCDKKIGAEEKRRLALQQLFRTALHLLMTGRVRVKIEAAS